MTTAASTIKIPKFIYLFSYLYIAFSVLVLASLPLKEHGDFSLYGLKGSRETVIGMVIISLILFKGIVGYAFVTNKSYWLTIALIEALFGIFIYVIVLILRLTLNHPTPSHYSNEIGFSIFFLPYYLYTLWKLKFGNAKS